MKLKLELEMNTAAFGEDETSCGDEARRILHHLAQYMSNTGAILGDKIILRDYNGNVVGIAEVVS